MATFLLRYKGEEILLPPGEFSLGRAIESSLHLDDERASRNHAVLYVEADSVELEDLESRNGVYVNGARVPCRMPVKHGDAIMIGAQRLELIEDETRKRRAVSTTVGYDDRPSDSVRAAASRDTLSEDLDLLSARELEVLRLIARGHTHKEVAEQLHVSVKTIETYRARIATKLGLKTRAELVKYAMEAGLLEGEP
jgi:RNA polymerase sigma factor (sigma-70 family)